MRTLAHVLEEAQSRHVVAVVKDAYSMKEAANDLGISIEYLRKLRKRYGLAIQLKRPARKLETSLR